MKKWILINLLISGVIQCNEGTSSSTGSLGRSSAMAVRGTASGEGGDASLAGALSSSSRTLSADDDAGADSDSISRSGRRAFDHERVSLDQLGPVAGLAELEETVEGVIIGDVFSKVIRAECPGARTHLERIVQGLNQEEIRAIQSDLNGKQKTRAVASDEVQEKRLETVEELLARLVKAQEDDNAQKQEALEVQIRLTKRGRWWTLGTGTTTTVIGGICSLVSLGAGWGLKEFQQWLSNK